MAEQTVLVLVLLGELSAYVGVMLRGGKGHGAGCFICPSPVWGPMGITGPPPPQGLHCSGGSGQIQPSKTLLWAPLVKVRWDHLESVSAGAVRTRAGYHQWL